jgi:hypothetical protein
VANEDDAPIHRGHSRVAHALHCHIGRVVEQHIDPIEKKQAIGAHNRTHDCALRFICFGILFRYYPIRFNKRIRIMAKRIIVDFPISQQFADRQPNTNAKLSLSHAAHPLMVTAFHCAALAAALNAQ